MSPEPPALDLYSGEPQHEVFPVLDEILPSRVLRRAGAPLQWPDGPAMTLPKSFSFDGAEIDSERFLRDTDTVALLVLEGGEVRHESYRLTGGRERKWISWSVAKSVVSTLVGIAIDRGSIGSVGDSIDEYVPKLVGTAYEGVRIEAVLHMASGVRWNEDYSDPESDIHRFGAAIAAGGSLDDFVAGMSRATEPDTLCQYNSADTQALGMLVIGATGRTLTELTQDWLCEPLGFESDGCWLTDSAGVEMAFGGMMLTARDFARVGELFRRGGRWGDRQIVSEEWVRRSTTSHAPHLEPGRVIVGGHVFPFGYGYQWWVPAGERGEFSAIGVYNQFVYVDPSRRVTIVKQSANRAYGTTTDEAENREAHTMELLRAIAAAAS